MAGPLEKTLYGASAFAPDEVIELPDNLSPNGLGAEDHPGDGSGDQQDWRNRKQRVVGEGRAQP